MKNIASIVLLLFSGILSIAQNKVPSPDVNKMLKMSPAELEAYKKEMLKQTSQYATEFSKQNNLNLSPSLIPGAEIKPPEKDIKRLSLIPSRPPTRNELVSQVQQSIQQIQKGMPTPKIEEIQKFTSTQKIETIHDAAISSFYNNDPKEAITLLLIAAKESPDSLQLLNNLGAMLNMVGAEEKAIPLLQYCLNQLPNSSTVLNNIGQSFLGLGDLIKAADYLNKCLAIDSLNVEANHSMGMLHSFKKEYDLAIKYFNRELSVAFRASSMAAAYKTGKKFNLRELTKQKNRRNGRPEKNHFEEISLEKFSIPDYPATAQELTQRKSALIEYGKSIQEELFFWKNTALQTLKRYDQSDADKLPGMYAPLVKAMLEVLSEEFHPKYLNNFSDYDAQQLKEIINTYSTELIRVKCPPPPAGTGFEAQRAYEIKCCEEKQRPIIDKMFSEIAGLFEPILNVGQQRWKSYINQLVAIVELDPTISNQAMVYEAVSAYFNYLSWGSIYLNNESALNLIPSCVDEYNPEDLDSLIASDRAWRLKCPPMFNLEANLGTITLKADCSKYSVEGGEGVVAGLEYEFASKKSTLLLGVGTKAEFLKGVIKAEVKSQFYLTFDENKKLADFGVKNSGEIGISGTPFPIRGIKLGGTLAGVEVSDTYSLNSGYREDKVEGKGLFAK